MRSLLGVLVLLCAVPLLADEEVAMPPEHDPPVRQSQKTQPSMEDESRAAAEASPPSKRLNLRPFLFYEKSDTRSGFELLYPFLEVKRDEERSLFSIYPLFAVTTTDYETRIDYLFPLSRYLSFGVISTGEFGFSFRLYPLFGVSSEREPSKFALDLLWPLGRFSKTEEETNIRLLPLFWFSKAEDESLFYLFPFYFKSRTLSTDEEGKIRRRSKAALYPLIRFEKGYSRKYGEFIRLQLLNPLFFPLLLDYTSFRNGKIRRIYALTRLIGVGISDYSLQAYLFPLFFARVTKRREGHIVIFPLFWHYSRKDYTLSVLLPIFAHYRNSDDRQLLIGPFGFWHNCRQDITTYFLFYPFSYIHDSKDLFAVRILPWLYGYERTKESVLIDFFPLYFRKNRKEGTYTYSVFPVWFRSRTKNGVYTHLWPLFGYAYSLDGFEKEFSVAFPFLFHLLTDSKTGVVKLHLFSPGILNASLILYEQDILKEYHFTDGIVKGREKTLTVVPLFKYKSSPERVEFHFPYPYFPVLFSYRKRLDVDRDPIYDVSAGVSLGHLPFYYDKPLGVFLFRYHSDEERTDFSLLYPVSAVYYKKRPLKWEAGLVGGLLGVGADGDDDYMRLLWFFKLF